MRNAWRAIGFLVLVCVLAGCPFLKKKAAPDAGEEAGLTDSGEVSDATTDAAPAPTAENEAKVKRYDDETKLDHVSATILSSVANVKTEAGAGEPVSVLKKGTEVSKLGEHAAYTLITFSDPGSADKKLMGWVGNSAFTAEVATGDAGKRIEDAGAVPLDAGKDSGVADAGAAAKDAGVDAGHADAGTSKPLTVKKNGLGLCNAGYAVSGDICRLACAKDADCGAAGRCQTKKCYPK